jgi:hypothetical protein
MSGQKSKTQIIDERKANLPLPEEPPIPSDWNTKDQRAVNVAKGTEESDIATQEAVAATAAETTAGLIRGPATKGSGVREEDGVDLSAVGREGEEHLGGLPKDALKKKK